MNTLSGKPIRVLCVFGSLDRGGAETMCMNLLRNIDRSKVIFDFVKHTEREGAYEKEIKGLGGRIYTCPPLRVKNYFEYVKWWRRHFINHTEHYIVHGHMFTTAGLYFKEAHRLGRKTIGHSHCANTNQAQSGRNVMELFVRQKLRDMVTIYSDYRFACSFEAGQLLFPHDKFEVVPNAIDSAQFLFDPCKRNRIRTEFSINDDCRLLAVVGRISEEKNPLGIIKLCRIIESKNNNWKLLWCGSGEMKDIVEEKIYDYGLNNHIILAGVRSDIPDILQAADMFLMPSLFEGLPVAAIEAQAAGIPCFCSNSISSEVQITEMCHLLPIGDWELWASCILNEPIKRVNTQKQIIDAGFDVHETAKRLQDFYLRVAAGD